MYRVIVIGLMLLSALPTGAQAAGPEVKARKAVLVTGASTGIGRRITERLAADGYFVFAGARKESDLEALGAIRNVQAVRLDVTNPQDIAAAVDTVRKGGRGLYGLVNNAGVATFGSVLDSKQEEFDVAMAVNVFGPYRVTKAFASLIIAEKGRIVTIGSVRGIFAGKNLSAYSMSKHAIEAFTDSLALEMEPLGVQVSVIEPGKYNTELGRNAAERIGLPPHSANRPEDKGNPSEVAAAVALALFEPSPKRRYMVVPFERDARNTIEQQIAKLVQLNEGHAYTYDREALVKMLDEALAQSRPRAK